MPAKHGSKGAFALIVALLLGPNEPNELEFASVMKVLMEDFVKHAPLENGTGAQVDGGRGG